MKTAVTKYQYIEYLVCTIKFLHKEGKNFDWYFDELTLLYRPLIQVVTKRVYLKLRPRVNFSEIKIKVVEIFFDSILRYEPTFNDGTEHCQNGNKFSYVYFSNYLKRKLPWDVMRLYKPTKIDYDDLSINSKNVELNLTNLSKEVQAKLEANNHTKPISDNFINLCKVTKKELKNDLLSDIMILHYGYDYKNNEIAKFFNITPLKVSNSLTEIKKFWEQNKEHIYE